MRRAGRITAAARALAGKMVRPGVTTLEIDRAVRSFIEGQGIEMLPGESLTDFLKRVG